MRGKFQIINYKNGWRYEGKIKNQQRSNYGELYILEHVILVGTWKRNVLKKGHYVNLESGGRIKLTNFNPEQMYADRILHERCPICYESLLTVKGEMIDCSHIFCSECLDHWFEELIFVCPLCKKIRIK